MFLLITQNDVKCAFFFFEIVSTMKKTLNFVHY